MASNPLVGVWRLVSYQRQRGEGEVFYPFGHEVAGYVIYTEEMRMSVAFMPANRPRLTTEDPRGRGGTPEEKVGAYDSYQSYAGRYEIQGDTVLHHVEIAMMPNLVGMSRLRYFEVEGDRLTLRPEPVMSGGERQTGTLVWKRVR